MQKLEQLLGPPTDESLKASPKILKWDDFEVTIQSGRIAMLSIQVPRRRKLKLPPLLVEEGSRIGQIFKLELDPVNLTREGWVIDERLTFYGQVGYSNSNGWIALFENNRLDSLYCRSNTLW